jgi:hypothetical protein
MPGLRLDDLDRDGALADAFDGLHGRTRFSCTPRAAAARASRG